MHINKSTSFTAYIFLHTISYIYIIYTDKTVDWEAINTPGPTQKLPIFGPNNSGI